MGVTTAASAETEQRVARLSAVSVARVVEPDLEVTGRVGDGQLLPDEVLLPSVGLDPDVLDRRQIVRLSRETVAAIAIGGIRFEAILMAGFSLQLAGAADFTDPRLTYLLHEMGEETRHSRLFARLVEQIGPTATNPFDRFPGPQIMRLVTERVIHMPALLYTMVLAGEEIPDLMQKLAAEHPDTDPFVRAVNVYHRQEEARHLAFARLMLPEVWERAGRAERLAVRFAAPTIIREMYENLVHPGVFQTAGLPGLRAWRAAREHPGRVSLRQRATRPVLAALVEAGAITAGRIPRGWRHLCGVDAAGNPQD